MSEYSRIQNQKLAGDEVLKVQLSMTLIPGVRVNILTRRPKGKMTCLSQVSLFRLMMQQSLELT